MSTVMVFKRTGKFAHPKQWDWFIDPAVPDKPSQAQLDFSRGQAEMLEHIEVKETTLMHRGEPCEFCKMAHDDIGVGYCPGKVVNGILVEAP